MKLYQKVKKFLEKYGLHWIVTALLGGYVVFYWFPVHPVETARSFSMFFAILPVALPFLIIELFGYTWMSYIWQKHYHSVGHVVLEIKIPDEINQTPYAMELVLRALYQTGDIDTPMDRYLKGVTLPWFSLELVSTEGQVRFYVWCRRKYKNMVETQMYAHYPSVQIHEVPDYTLRVPLDLNKIQIFAIEQKLQKPDPIPVATYVEFELDKRGEKEEFKHDPMASILELFGSLQKGEHAWMQIVFRAHSANNSIYVAPYSHDYTHHHLTIDKWAEHIIEEIAEETRDKKGEGAFRFNQLSEGDRKLIEAIQLKQNKQLFDTGIRMLYIAPKGQARSAVRVGFPSVMRSFEHGAEARGLLNGFKPIFCIGPFYYPWQDFMGIRRRKLQTELYEAYVYRQFFYPPFRHEYMVLNSEEIATIYHFPGKVAKTPTLERMLSRRADAPANLPQ